MELDLANLKSIQTFVAAFKSKIERLDTLINNGGPIGLARNLTEDGFESHFGINHLGHFALTGQLLDVLLNTPFSRVVTVSSRMHVDGEMAWDDLMGEKSYNPWTAYRQSKLANLLFTFELSRKLEVIVSPTKAIAVHPGLAKTGWADNNFGGFMRFLGKIMSLSYQSASMGALPALYAAIDEDAKNGGFYGPVNDKKGYPAEIRASDAAYDEDDARRLWDLSEELTGIQYSI